jgi:hypothetical protein
MNHNRLFAAGFLAVTIFIFAGGCTHSINISPQPTALAPREKLPLRADLVLDKGLTDYSYQLHMMGDTWDYHFGPPLRDYARRVAGASFRAVNEVASADKAYADASADIFLIPRAVKAEESMGLLAMNDVHLTLVVEWRAEDRTRNSIWLKTITANATEVEGNVFTGDKHRKILMQKLFDDLNAKTHEAIHNAPELRSIAH